MDSSSSSSSSLSSLSSSCSNSSSPSELAVAALIGASLVAISAFFFHKRSVDQVLHRLITEIRRTRPNHNDRFVSDDNEEEDEQDEGGFGSEEEIASQKMWKQRSVTVDENALRSHRVSSSLPNALSSSSSSLGRLDSRLRRRDVTSRSTGENAYESTGDSDEEGTELANEEHMYCTCGNDVNPNSLNPSVVPFGVDGITHIDKKKSTLSDRNVSLDLHSNGKIDTASTPIAGIVGNDSILTSMLLPLRSEVQESTNKEEKEVWKMIRDCLDMRGSYVFKEKITPWKKTTMAESGASQRNIAPFHFDPVEASAHQFRMVDGVVHVYASKDDSVDLFPVASSTEFFTDLHHLLNIISNGNVSTACDYRLRLLEEKFRQYLLVNADKEFLAQKGAPHRDFYNIRLVDTHVHHSACMGKEHLLEFIKTKLRNEPDEVVIFRDGKYLTLLEVFKSLEITAHDLNVDMLDVHADKSTFHRFDKFNLKYNPCGQSRLREIFLKQDNIIQGRFLADLTKEVLSDLEARKYQMAEYRVSIYGRKQSEWDQLASWFVNNSIYSKNVVWLIQLPRLYNVYKEMGIVTSFQNILDNVFIPLFEVTIDPSSHPHLHVFLRQVVGFDLVDDESKPERHTKKHMPTPSEWTIGFNPAYSYYAYYCYANLYTLNKLRESKGMSTIKFRPHCGEAGNIDHLAAAFLLCHNISHGINLRKSLVLQYLYYLAQIGLAMSPLSNNSLFLDIHRNPFALFFQRGLNVSLSTDDPLQIHISKDPLVEEYLIAKTVWKLSFCDLCEIARNAVYQSGFSHVEKLRWLGNNYFIRGPKGNDIHKTNVPPLRITYRYEAWKEEMQYVYSGKARFPEDIDH